jgi:hypothetical protein
MEKIRIKSSLVSQTRNIFKTINRFVSKGWLKTKKKLPVDPHHIKLILRRGTLLISVMWQSYIISRYSEKQLPRKKKIYLIQKILGQLPEAKQQGLTKNTALATYILDHIKVLSPVFEHYLKKGYAKKTFQRGGAPLLAEGAAAAAEGAVAEGAAGAAATEGATAAEEAAAEGASATNKVAETTNLGKAVADDVVTQETASRLGENVTNTDDSSRKSKKSVLGRLENVTEPVEEKVGPPSQEVEDFVETDGASEQPAPFNFLVPLKFWEDRLGFVLSIPLEFITGLLSFVASTLQIIGSVMAIIPGNPSAGLFIIGAAIVFLVNIVLNLLRANWPVVVHSLLGMFPFILEAVNGFSLFVIIQKNKFEHDIKAMTWLENAGNNMQGLARILFPWWEPVKRMTYHD